MGLANFGYFQTALIFVIFKKRAGVFYPVKNHEVQPSGCRPYTGRAASFLNGLETFLKKRVSIDFITIMLSQMLEICIREKHFRCKSVCKKIKSYTCFELFFYKGRGHGVLFQNFSEA